MANSPTNIVICSCEDTMPLDGKAVAEGLPRRQGHHGAPSVPGGDRALPHGDPQRRSADDCLHAGSGSVRRGGGRSRPQGRHHLRQYPRNGGLVARRRDAGPKMAALLAAAAEPLPAVPIVNLESEGVILIYGCDERAVEAGNLLKEPARRDRAAQATGQRLRRRAAPSFPIVQGTIRDAKGHLGAFEITVDDFAQPAPSSRGELAFGRSRNGAKSHCDIILDLSGGSPLFPAADLRDGYLRADPNDPAAMLKAVLKARDLVGTFEKPRYITFDDDLCAHSRSRIVGCNRCLDLCPTGRHHAGGQSCRDRRPDLRGLRPVRRRLPNRCGLLCAAAGRRADAQAAHASDHLSRCRRRARHCPPARRGARRGIDRCAGASWRWSSGQRAAARGQRGDAGRASRPLPQPSPTVRRRALPAARTAAPRRRRIDPDHRAGRADSRRRSGFGADRVATIETDDPDALGGTLRAIPAMQPAPRPANFLPTGAKRSVLRFALRELHRAAPQPVDVVPLPARAPFGIGGDRCRRLHAVPLVRIGLPDRRADRRSGAAHAALRRGCLRAVRAVQGDLSGEGHHA